MPYPNNQSLNSRTKKALPSGKKRTIFRKVFTAVLKKTGDESQAFKIAYAKANKNSKMQENIILSDDISLMIEYGDIKLKESARKRRILGGMKTGRYGGIRGRAMYDIVQQSRRRSK
jgi:hypothetical protein